jgi:hypothetical protein
MNRKLPAIFSALFLFACGRTESVDLKCGARDVSGSIAEEVAELKIDGSTRTLPLQIVFSDEYAARHAPEYLSNPSFAMTVKTYVGLSLADEKIEFAVYSRAGKTEYYELEIEGKKWLCR